MERKKWTPREVVTDEVLKFREKRKWQLALRRYVLEKNRSAFYAFYFGLDIVQFREWISIQFKDGLSWENFGIAWQFDHVLPIGYFDFSKEEELKLCWNFINIRVERIEPPDHNHQRIDILTVKPYFERLYKKTGAPACLQMIEKIQRIETQGLVEEPAIEDFLLKNKERIETIATLTVEEFNNLNSGMNLQDLLLEREILKKFG